MAVILAILGAIAGIAYWLWRINAGIQAGRALGGAARGVFRHAAWSGEVGSLDKLEGLDDPREAATILMIAVAKAEGGPSSEQRGAILGEMASVFQMDTDEADGLYSHALWISSEIVDIAGRMRKLAEPILLSCTSAEADDVSRRMNKIAEMSGTISPLQQQIIDRYGQILRETRA